MLPPPKASGTDGTTHELTSDSSTEAEEDAQNGDAEEEHQDFFQGEDGESELEVLKHGVPEVDHTGPLGEPIIMYPNLIAARLEYITASQVGNLRAFRSLPPPLGNA